MSQDFLHKDREAMRMPMMHVQKLLQHYVTNLIDIILSVMSDFILSNIFQLLIATLYFHH